MTKRQKVKLGLILSPLGLILSLFILWIVFVWPIYKTIQSRNWPQVECKIDFYQVKEAGMGQGQLGNVILYKANLQYSYQFDDKNYISTRYSFDYGVPFTKRTMNINEIRKCYVNPRNPGESVLFRRYNFFYLLLSLIPALMLGACAYGFYRCLKTLQKYSV
jgi:hypothetical protein